ncbi:MAG: hypothetical protein IJY63_03645 [Clostridia bacterium]|nr:hypothetical protein [Clostridia bacterium]
MEIDIISYTPSQFTVLNEQQLAQVQEAQMKKNTLLKELEENLQREKEGLIEKGMLHSNVWVMLEAKLRAECDEAVAWIKESLLFYLRYSGAEALANAPYKVDFTLPEEERLEIVKAYYYETYADPLVRLNAYEKDEIAMKYLGETYNLLYAYLQDDL